MPSTLAVLDGLVAKMILYGMIAAAMIFAEYENLGLTFYLGASAIVVAILLHPGLERRFGIRPSPGGLV